MFHETIRGSYGGGYKSSPRRESLMAAFQLKLVTTVRKILGIFWEPLLSQTVHWMSYSKSLHISLLFIQGGSASPGASQRYIEKNSGNLAISTFSTPWNPDIFGSSLYRVAQRVCRLSQLNPLLSKKAQPLFGVPCTSLYTGHLASKFAYSTLRHLKGCN